MTFLHNGRSISRDITISINDPSEFSSETLAANGLVAREQAGPLGVSRVEAGTPADRAGLQPGDQVVRVDALDIHSVQTLLAYLKDRNGAPAVLSVLRKGQPLTLAAVPEKMSVCAPNQFCLGFQALKPPVDLEKLPVAAAARQSFKDNRDDSKLIFNVLQGMFTRHVSVKSLSGPVGIAQQIDLATQLGAWTLLQMMSTISINLAIFNLLPFPPLDGGMIFFLLVESIIRRDVNQQVKERIYQVAFVCIIFLAIFVMFNDITRLHIGKP
jgi:regulator of sigma E protease